jgi:hypothetical protein
LQTISDDVNVLVKILEETFKSLVISILLDVIFKLLVILFSVKLRALIIFAFRRLKIVIFEEIILLLAIKFDVVILFDEVIKVVLILLVLIKDVFVIFAENILVELIFVTLTFSKIFKFDKLTLLNWHKLLA